jgi:DNA ligase D-like protein (predicted ligase)
MPHWVEPMLATLVDEAPAGGDWIFERKLDGQRCLAFSGGDGLRLLSRNRKLQNATYPELVDALAGRKRFIVDGEIVAFDRDGQTSFSRLQRRMHVADASRARGSSVAVTYFVFDLLWFDGDDVTAMPQIERKRMLGEVFSFVDPIRPTEHSSGDGDALFNDACVQGWEGLIAKEAGAPYVAGRSRHWLKLKCVNEQEVVIGGYTDPRGSRVGFGAILVGYYEGDRLVYAGKVGTGFDETTLAAMAHQLGELATEGSPFADGDPPTKDVHWVEPTMVGEVAFNEWTPAGRLRAPRFLGLRTDKAATDVVRERPS